jgi:palmitoyltransferase
MTFSYFPLVFVYGLTSWAVYVQVSVSFLGGYTSWAFLEAGLGIALFAFADISYTTAVFTSPGSPLDAGRNGERVGRRKAGGYQGLPMHEDERDDEDNPVPQELMSTVTAKSTGKPRYCKKCRCVKPDRSHHCSTCGRCVLKMDHHCPWLATCVGLRNYKAFLLFLVYLSVFCWVCFASTAVWVYAEIMNSHPMQESILVVNVIVLAVISGIIGLVISGFTGWHIYLTMTGQTTIESLEKTRYLAPLRKTLEPSAHAPHATAGQVGEYMKETHANALPGVLRAEEGDTLLDPSLVPQSAPSQSASYQSQAASSLHRSYASMEAQRERDRYNNYLDEEDSEKMPNAFDHGWKRNMIHVFGEQPLLWGIPICNTSGNGWMWDVSPKWLEARERVGREREQRDRQSANWYGQSGGIPAPSPRQPQWRWNGSAGFVDESGNAPTAAAASQPGQSSLLPPPPRTSSAAQDGVQMQPIDCSPSSPALSTNVERYSSSNDDASRTRSSATSQQEATTNWNDVPDDFLDSRNGGSGHRAGRRKGE